jgi:hypothetical protein
MTKYRTIDTRTLKGLKQAERLHTTGWKMTQVGLYIIKFEKRIDKRKVS